MAIERNYTLALSRRKLCSLRLEIAAVIEYGAYIFALLIQTEVATVKWSFLYDFGGIIIRRLVFVRLTGRSIRLIDH
jgi:hypothetical protein